MIQREGQDLEAKHEAYIKKNRKLINRIRTRLEAEERARLKQEALPAREKLRSLAQGSHRPKLHFPDPGRPNKRNKEELVKLA